MINSNYVTQLESHLAQKYAKELLTNDLTTKGIEFFGGNTIRIPFGMLDSYIRGDSFTHQGIYNRKITKVLSHDRDAEFQVDTSDVDEAEQMAAATNITNVFESEYAIPETDAYRLSKIYQDFVEFGGIVDDTSLDANNVLAVYDKFMHSMDKVEVPKVGRILYATPAVNRLLEQSTKLNQRAYYQDKVKVVVVPIGRMFSAYDFTNSFDPMADAKQINMMLTHPSAVIAATKHSYIKLWPPGTHTLGDMYLYQNRRFSDLFVVEARLSGIAINAN